MDYNQVCSQNISISNLDIIEVWDKIFFFFLIYRDTFLILSSVITNCDFFFSYLS